VSLSSNTAVAPSVQYGGGKVNANLSEIKSYITPYSLEPHNATSVNYKYVGQFVLQAAQAELRKNPELLICHMPLEILKGKISLGQAKSIAKMHNVTISKQISSFRGLGGFISTYVFIAMFSILYIVCS
jgi:hypothetical protein